MFDVYVVYKCISVATILRYTFYLHLGGYNVYIVHNSNIYGGFIDTIMVELIILKILFNSGAIWN